MAAGHLLTVAMGFYKIKLLYHGAVAAPSLCMFCIFSARQRTTLALSARRAAQRPAGYFILLSLSRTRPSMCVCVFMIYSTTMHVLNYLWTLVKLIFICIPMRLCY
jgi:hypothetical protein